MAAYRLRQANSEIGKGRLAYFSPKCTATIPLLRKNIFPFSYVALFGHNKSAIVNFLAKFGAISPSPENRGIR